MKIILIARNRDENGRILTYPIFDCSTDKAVLISEANTLKEANQIKHKLEAEQ